MLLLLLRCSDNNWCDDGWWFYGMLAHDDMIKFKTKLSINWYTIIVTAIPSYVFNLFFCGFSSYSCFKLPALSRVLTNVHNSFHSITLSYHTSKNALSALIMHFFTLAACVCVFLLSLLFSLLFVFSLIKDNSNNNCFFYIFCLLPSHVLFICCVCVSCFSLSFLLYCMVYYKKLFTSCFEPSQLALPAFFSFFLFEIYHWIINFNVLPPKSISLTPTAPPLPAHSNRWFLILLALLLPKHIYNCFCLFCFLFFFR